MAQVVSAPEALLQRAISNCFGVISTIRPAVMSSSDCRQYNLDVEAIQNALGVDALQYPSIAGLLEAVPHDNGAGYDTACFPVHSPVGIDAEANTCAGEERR